MSRMSLIIGMLIPRLVTLALYLMGYFEDKVQTALVIAGILLMPTTLLWYGVIQRSFGGEWGIVQVAGLLVAILIDFGPLAPRRKVPVAH